MILIHIFSLHFFVAMNPFGIKAEEYNGNEWPTTCAYRLPSLTSGMSTFEQLKQSVEKAKAVLSAEVRGDTHARNYFSATAFGAIPSSMSMTMGMSFNGNDPLSPTELQNHAQIVASSNNNHEHGNNNNNNNNSSTLTHLQNHPHPHHFHQSHFHHQQHSVNNGFNTGSRLGQSLNSSPLMSTENSGSKRSNSNNGQFFLKAIT